MTSPADEPRAGLQPPQFGLGFLLGAVAILGVLFAIAHYFGMLGALVAVFALLCVLAHVLGNALGTKLRDIGSQSPGSDERVVSGPRFFSVSPEVFGPASKLHAKQSLGKRILAITLAGALVGGLLGGLGLDWLTDGKSAWPVLVLGAGAAAVLAAIWTFAAASFVQVLAGAWFQAAHGPHKKRW